MIGIVFMAMLWSGLGSALAMRQAHFHGSQMDLETVYVRVLLGTVTGPLFPLFFPIKSK